MTQLPCSDFTPNWSSSTSINRDVNSPLFLMRFIIGGGLIWWHAMLYICMNAKTLSLYKLHKNNIYFLKSRMVLKLSTCSHYEAAQGLCSTIIRKLSFPLFYENMDWTLLYLRVPHTDLSSRALAHFCPSLLLTALLEDKSVWWNKNLK